MSKAAIMAAIRERAKTDPIGARIEAHDIGREFYELGHEIARTETFKTAMVKGVEEMTRPV